MTLDDIKAMEGDWITPATAAKVLKMDPGRVVWYAKNKQLPFPAMISGDRVKIPRAGFLKFFGIEEEGRQKQDSTDALLEEIVKQMKINNVLLTALINKYAPVSLSLLSDQIREIKEA